MFLGSDGDSLLLDGFQVVSDQFARVLTVESDANSDNVAETFQATMVPSAPLDPNMDLGPDVRELELAEVRRDADLHLEWGAQLTDGCNHWRVIRRIDNPSDIGVRYWLRKIVPGKDTPAP